MLILATRPTEEYIKTGASIHCGNFSAYELPFVEAYRGAERKTRLVGWGRGKEPKQDQKWRVRSGLYEDNIPIRLHLGTRRRGSFRQEGDGASDGEYMKSGVQRVAS